MLLSYLSPVLNVNLALLRMRYPAALQVVRRRIGILRFELGMMNALQIDVVHDVLTVLLPPFGLLVRFLATYGNVEHGISQVDCSR